MVSVVGAATRVVMTLAFAPKGGSAHVTRSLARALENDTLDVILRCGSIGSPGSGHDEVARALNCADVLVAPSVDEAFGLVYIEAMAAGLPVIATDSGGPPTFVNTDRSRPNGWLVRPETNTIWRWLWSWR